MESVTTSLKWNAQFPWNQKRRAPNVNNFQLFHNAMSLGTSNIPLNTYHWDPALKSDTAFWRQGGMDLFAVSSAVTHGVSVGTAKKQKLSYTARELRRADSFIPATT